MENKPVISLQEIRKLKSQIEKELLVLRSKEAEIINELDNVNQKIQKFSGQFELLIAFEKSCIQKQNIKDIENKKGG